MRLEGLKNLAGMILESPEDLEKMAKVAAASIERLLPAEGWRGHLLANGFTQREVEVVNDLRNAVTEPTFPRLSSLSTPGTPVELTLSLTDLQDLYDASLRAQLLHYRARAEELAITMQFYGIVRN